MKRTLHCMAASLLLAIGLSAVCSANAATRSITDMAGRKVLLPATIHKVYATSPVGTIFLYTLAPEMLAGWNTQLTPAELNYIPAPYRSLPVLGGWFGKNNTGNIEEILRAHPDVILSMGDLLSTQLADRIQQQTHIPVIVLDGALKSTPESYRRAGQMLGCAARAEQLAKASAAILTEITSKTSTIPIEKRRRYYYAEGVTGLETEPGGSVHTETMDMAGGVNVANIQGKKGYGHSEVSIEQILVWKPDILLVANDHAASPGEFYRTAPTSPLWSHLSAIRNHQIFEAPNLPQSWMDRPASVNRLIGLEWLANLFYPERFSYDIRQRTRIFYRTFYHYEISETQLQGLLATAIQKR